MPQKLLLSVFGVFVLGLFVFTMQQPSGGRGQTLESAYADVFKIGVAIKTQQSEGEEPEALAIAGRQFNSVTPENLMKWALIHPQPERYEFGPADRFVEWAEAQEMFIVGHTLVWHSQTPAWVFQDEAGNPATREMLLARMRDHIRTVVGRYRGRVDAWDVVNEAVEADGSLRETPWLRIIGPDYLDFAFRFAHEADPEAKLYYNDFSLDEAPKRQGVVRLLRGLLERGVPLDGVGSQEHISVEWPPLQHIEDAILELASLGIPVMITELDVDVLPRAFEHSGADVSLSAELRAELNPYVDGLPPERMAQLTARYAALFRIYYRHRDKLDRVTFWGLNDGGSWLNYWPIRGRTSYPLLYDRNNLPKPALQAILSIAEKGAGND